MLNFKFLYLIIIIDAMGICKKCTKCNSIVTKMTRAAFLCDEQDIRGFIRAQTYIIAGGKRRAV